MKWRYQLALLVIRTKFKILSAFSKSKAASAAFDLFCTPLTRYNAPLTATFLAAENISLQWEQFNIRGFQWNSGAIRKVLIVHGFQSSAVNFEVYIQPLIDAGCEVTAFDAPAHGGSSGKRVNVIIYRNFIRFIQQQFGPFDAVMAHSFGGLALCLAMEEWPGDKAPSLALIAPATETQTAVDQFFQTIRLKDKKVHDAFNNIIVNIGGRPAEWYSIRRVLQSNDFSVLWIHDENDDITPIADAENAWKVLPNIEIVRTHGLGHRRIYRDKEIVKTVVNFLTNTDAGS
ncbi:MAG: alpha/beta hydrolase [Chitinophagaceae bacterium]|nr:alpha/beta hydrolase [Chitinophagaceae bacterium]